MSTSSELIAARATAGAAYASAITALRAAYIEIAALDIVCAMPSHGGDGNPRTFRGEAETEGIPWPWRHLVYAAGALGGIGEAVKARGAAIDFNGL